MRRSPGSRNPSDLLVLVLRHHMTRAPELKGFLAALKDERVARALTALHRKPGERWRVDTLAREAGMSRTVFAERFAALLGPRFREADV